MHNSSNNVVLTHRSLLFMNMYVHHRLTFPIQFLPDPRISLVNILLVNILLMAQPLLPNTGYTWGTKTKDAFPSVTIQFRGLISSTWMAHINTCSGYIDGIDITITLPFSLWLNTHYSGIVCGEKWLDKTVPGKKCLDKIQVRKRNFMNIIPSMCFYPVLLLLLLAHGQAETKSESVYQFPSNSIVPTSQQWRENSCVWNASHAMECRPVLMSWFFFFSSFFFAVPSSVPTSEALLPRRSSRHPPPSATPRAHYASWPHR